MSDEGVELSDVIREVRGDLEKAIWAAEGKQLGFQLGEVELQVEVAVTRAATPGGKLKLLVVDASMKHERSKTTRHHVKVTLQPRLRDRPDQQPWVSGPVLEGEE